MGFRIFGIGFKVQAKPSSKGEEREGRGTGRGGEQGGQGGRGRGRRGGLLGGSWRTVRSLSVGRPIGFGWEEDLEWGVCSHRLQGLHTFGPSLGGFWPVFSLYEALTRKTGSLFPGGGEDEIPKTMKTKLFASA